MIGRIKKYNMITAGTLAVFIVFLIWHLGSIYTKSNLLVPNINDTFFALGDVLSKFSTYKALLNLLKDTLISLSIGAFLGIASGILAFHFNFYYHFSKGFIVFFRSVPRISIILLLIIMVGYKASGYLSLIILIIPIAFDIVLTGLNEISKEYYDSFKLEANGFFKTLRYFYLPFLKSHIFLILLQGIGFGIKVMVMTDYLTLSKNTVGANLYWSKVNIDYNYVFAWTILIVILSITLDSLLRAYIKMRKAK